MSSEAHLWSGQATKGPAGDDDDLLTRNTLVGLSSVRVRRKPRGGAGSVSGPYL
jgi:hypothetical protein